MNKSRAPRTELPLQLAYVLFHCRRIRVDQRVEAKYEIERAISDHVEPGRNWLIRGRRKWSQCALVPPHPSDHSSPSLGHVYFSSHWRRLCSIVFGGRGTGHSLLRAEKLSRIRSRLSIAQIRETDRLVKEWKEQHRVSPEVQAAFHIEN